MTLRNAGSAIEPARVRAHLAEMGADVVNVCHRVETGSTNDDARLGFEAGASFGSVWIAERQTQGRGRSGNVWESESGANVMLSVLLEPLEDAAALTLAIGAELASRVREQLPNPAVLQIKWPNDIWLDQRKVCGILVESVYRGTRPRLMIAGVGLNVRQTSFGELDRTATSLARAGVVAASDRDLWAAVTIAAVQRAHAVFERAGLAPWHGRLSAWDALLGRTIRIETGEGDLLGEGAGIDARGRLLVRSPTGTEAVAAGHVVLLDANNA